MSKSDNSTDIKRIVIVVCGVSFLIYLFAVLGEDSNNSSSSGQSHTQSNTISNENDVRSCIEHNTFRNSTVAGEITFSNDEFSYLSGRPVDTNWGFYVLNSKSNIRLIRNREDTQLPTSISVVDCNTLSISGRRFTR